MLNCELRTGEAYEKMQHAKYRNQREKSYETTRF